MNDINFWAKLVEIVGFAIIWWWVFGLLREATRACKKFADLYGNQNYTVNMNPSKKAEG